MRNTANTSESIENTSNSRVSDMGSEAGPEFNGNQHSCNSNSVPESPNSDTSHNNQISNQLTQLVLSNCESDQTTHGEGGDNAPNLSSPKHLSLDSAFSNAILEHNSFNSSPIINYSEAHHGEQQSVIDLNSRNAHCGTEENYNSNMILGIQNESPCPSIHHNTRTTCQRSQQDDTVSNGVSVANLVCKMDNGINEYGIRYLSYESELQMCSIMKLIQKDLSEPYSVYTYRYFIHNWPKLCFLAMDGDTMVGVIVCKLDVHKQVNKRGYIAMLAVDEKFRRKKIGSSLVLKSIRAMAEENADEIVLETEITNKSALRLYENLGFVRDKRLFRYYLNGVDALRLKLWLK